VDSNVKHCAEICLTEGNSLKEHLGEKLHELKKCKQTVYVKSKLCEFVSVVSIKLL